MQSDPISLAARENLHSYVEANPLSFVDRDGRVLEKLWDDPAERGRHLSKAKPYCQFLNRIRGKTLEKVIREEESEGYGTVLSAGGPFDEYRYVTDPANPKQVFDMRHFLVVGPSGELYGLLIEIHQYISKSDRPSAFDAQDFFSNYHGQRWYLEYYVPSGFDLESSLRKFFESRAKKGKGDCRCE